MLHLAKVHPPQLCYGTRYIIKQDLEVKKEEFTKKQHENIYPKGELSLITLKTTNVIFPFTLTIAPKATSMVQPAQTLDQMEEVWSRHSTWLSSTTVELNCVLKWLTPVNLVRQAGDMFQWKQCFSFPTEKWRILFWPCLIHSPTAGCSPLHTPLLGKAAPFSCAFQNSRLSGYRVHILKCTVLLTHFPFLKKKIKLSDTNSL